jgi:hypothetical protein
LPSPNLTETFSNRGLAPNCMVMFAVDIKVLFRRVKKYFHHEGQEGHEEKLIFVFFLSFEADINVK